ncbi:Mth938-like domain-containing protein [Paracoccus spongiarum]|uniref:Mth938-like domain-containing protein n=1 Tax=Paracoccus spongiarum TaxID=3064387 RepID=A0ABT9J8T0_9RHOB|nr:Mth938-like domain-containing protein [Paracoccus sp. 2205BS29-5]MDP5305567.1 Mth938-like domain-containing protein [Paracoccus sp. 2205BS29-5]
MAMKPVEFEGAVPVDGYGPGFFRVAGKVVEGPVLVEQGGARDWAGLDDRAPLMALSGRVDVLFLGMGAEIAHPPAALVEALESVGVMVEAMASPTAARTYNVTLSEGRRVACALLPV